MALDHKEEQYGDTYQSLLMAYAFGVLDRAQSLVVAAHLTLSPKARALTQACEHLAGALLEKDCPPAPMSLSAKDRIMAAITADICPNKACSDYNCQNLPEELGNLPHPLQEPMQGCTSFTWNSVGKGFAAYDIALGDCASKARFMKVNPGLKTPEHCHGGLEITLVLNGAVIENGALYRRGDLLVADETITHSSQACPQAGCVCMVVTSAPIKLTGIKSLLNPFLKF
ncbi:MAG: ChrR family anti-sigma-E factor [Alphaproteobacteria bacterium]|nr:ChrR family anti-sigma-E factor [Alphaproteobacteria bacterium]MCD8525952.1 ChrR family anti-sigma-E factor [Alphaproteobacteria bacterium]MCD8571076.1 ChrR family anti-sigma-E factor [Alphaproteobacteria bacterium]